MGTASRLARWRGRSYVDKLRRQYFDLEQKWCASVATWRARTGVASIENKFQELRSARSTYENLPSEEKAQLDAYERDRRERQLNAHLERFELRRTVLRNISRPEEAALASFGIETAADIVDSKLLRAPALAGDARSSLLDWRKRIEKQFSYQATENEVDRQEIARIRSNVEHQGAYLRRILLAGRSDLDNAVARLGRSLTEVDQDLASLHVQRAQLQAELQYLGVNVATLSALAANSNQLAGVGANRNVANAPLVGPTRTGSHVPTAAAAGNVRCPRCGSPMIRRLAKNRGAAAQQFWACARYPLCKGSRK